MRIGNVKFSAAFWCVLTLSLGLSATALANTAFSIKNLPDGSQVTLSGTVEDFESQRSFTLHDASGTVKIDLTSTQPIVLKSGAMVEVTGKVHNTILGTDVVASAVSEDKGVGQRVGEAIDSVTGQDAAGSARSVNIQSLPKSGLVKVDGIVDSVSSGKKFTLKDSTGHVDVAIKSGESASLRKGTEVTVVGNVDSGVLGTSIKAIEVDVHSSSAPMATQ